MVLHFIASEARIVRDIQKLRTIIKVLHGYGYALARDWVEPAYARRMSDRPYRDTDWQRVYNESIEALNRADVIIAEVSGESLSMGYQIAYAVRQKKPILLLRYENANQDMFVTGVKEPHIFQKEYKNEDELKKIISKFIEDNQPDIKDMRFNFFMDRKIHNYLRWAAYRSGNTKSEIVRNILRKDIEKGIY